MAFRKKMSRGKSRRDFTKKAVKVNPKNIQNTPMRGGYRM